MQRELAPGLRVVRRGTACVQVGLSADRRVVLPRTPSVLAALDRLLDRLPSSPHDDAVIARLEAAGCLVDPAQPRSTGSVGVLGQLGIDHVSLLEAAGLPLTSQATAEVVLVLAVGEVDRALLDPLVRRGTDHLVVRLVDGGARIGPFVVPGRTACLRCTDAQQLVRDPHHIEVTSRYVHATATPRADGVPDLDEPALAHLALAWAVRDVAAHLRGRRPATWSRTVCFGADPGSQAQTVWRRHPDCGCSWPGIEDPSGKMEV